MLLTAVVAAAGCVQALADIAYTATGTNISENAATLSLDGSAPATTISGNGVNLSNEAFSEVVEISGGATGNNSITTNVTNGGYGGRVIFSNNTPNSGITQLLINGGIEANFGNDNVATCTTLNVKFDNASFYGDASGFGFNIEVGSGGVRVNGGSGTDNIFRGSLTGAGNIVFYAGKSQQFTGDVSGFTGTWTTASSDKLTTLTFGIVGNNATACAGGEINGNIGTQSMYEKLVQFSYTGDYSINGKIYSQAVTVKKGNATFTNNASINRLTVDAGAKVVIDNTITTTGAIANSGTISTSETGVIVIDTAEFQNLGTIVGYSDTTTGNGYATYDTITVVNNTGEGTISGSLNVNVGGTINTTSTGVLSNITDESMYWVNTATVDANEINSSRYALNGGELEILEGKAIISKISDLTADTTGSSIKLGSDTAEAYLDFLLPSGTSKLSVTGNGKLSIGFTPTPTTGHGQTLNLGSDFNGTLSIREGFMMLNTFTVGTGATFELIGGEHWSDGTRTISNNIKLAATTEHGYVFRNQGTTNLTGQVTGTYLSVGKGYGDNGTLVLSNAANNIESVIVGNGRLKLTADAVFGKISTIGNANNRGLELGANVTMTLGNDTAATESSISLLVAGENSKVQLGSKATLNAIGAVTGSVTLAGTGTYNLGAVAKNAALTSLTANNSPVKLADGWSGTVKLSGGEHQIGASQLNKCVKDINFNNLGHSGSTVEIASNGLYGYFVGEDKTFNPNIKLTGDLYIQNGSGGKNYTFAGQISGDGSMKITRTTGGTNDLNFTGDIQLWKGELNQSGDKTTNISLSESATKVNAAIKNTGSGALNLTVNNSGKTTTFSKEVKVSSLNITAGSTMTVTAAETTEGENPTSTSKLSVGGDITFGQGAQLNVTGSITLDAASIKLAEGYTFSSAEAVTLVQVTNGNLTLNNVGSWTGSSTYEFDGSRYTTSLSAGNGLLQIVFNQEIIDQNLSLVVDSASLSGTVLTLNIDADLTDVSAVDLSLSVQALADIMGLSGEVSLALQAKDGLFTTVETDGATLISNVSFYGTYTGEKNEAGEATGMYRVEYIPEPATATLSLLALCGLAARRRRR